MGRMFRTIRSTICALLLYVWTPIYFDIFPREAFKGHQYSNSTYGVMRNAIHEVIKYIKHDYKKKPSRLKLFVANILLETLRNVNKNLLKKGYLPIFTEEISVMHLALKNIPK